MPVKDKPLNKVYHVLNIPEKEQDFITEKLDELRKTWMLTKAVRAAGEAAKGALGHPVGFAAIAGLIAAFLIAYFVRPDPDDPVISIEGRDLEKELIRILLGALPVSRDAVEAATDNVVNAVRTIRKLLGLPF